MRLWGARMQSISWGRGDLTNRTYPLKYIPKIPTWTFENRICQYIDLTRSRVMACHGASKPVPNFSNTHPSTS